MAALKIILADSREDRFRALYAAYAPVVRRIVHRLCHENDLDDLVQLAFIKVYERLDSVRDESSIKAWVCQVAVNTARDQLRKKRRSAWLRFFAPAELPQPEHAVPGAEERLASHEAVRGALACLSPKLRETVVLFSIEELEIREISVILGVPEGTVKSRLSQAREKLKGEKHDR